MATFFNIQLYKAISYGFWTVWKIIAYSILYLNFGENFSRMIISFLLLGYVKIRQERVYSRPQDQLIAHISITTQRRYRFFQFLLCWAWLYELASQAIVISSFPIFRGFMATLINNDGIDDIKEKTEIHPNIPAILSYILLINGFIKERAGFNPVAPLKIIPFKAFFICDALIWVSLFFLAIDILHVLWIIIRVVLFEPRRGHENLAKI